MRRFRYLDVFGVRRSENPARRVRPHHQSSLPREVTMEPSGRTMPFGSQTDPCHALYLPMTSIPSV